MQSKGGSVHKDHIKSASNVIQLEDQLRADYKESIQIEDPNQLIFALDIGTRNVVGIVGLQKDEGYEILAAEIFEHKNRAMLDGQIHDISLVASVAAQIKKRLEDKLGLVLDKVAIAAAGRVLKTSNVRVDKDIEQGIEIDKRLINTLEMEGIQKAQIELDEVIAESGKKTEFYCVGYSVVNYYLNELVISSLLGHKGYRMSADILATFLPHVVVDSLYTVMGKVGLEVVSLTLEPIAAIHVTIPKDLRLLNLALVDIGAGTSDIAITRNGSVIAYGMAPIAGDEITEAIAQHYLVDFNTAEQIKIALTQSEDKIKFTDILDISYEIDKNEIYPVIQPIIEALAKTICDKILEFNTKSPNAVFLIGGGSQVSGLTECIAATLGLPKERVAVRNKSVVKNVYYKGHELDGPEAITPIGILVTADAQKGNDFFSVTVNGTRVKLFNSKKLSVADALILVGFNPGQLIGKSGKSVTFTLNQIKKTVKGSLGKPAEIYVNQKLASLNTLIQPGDVIDVQDAESGEDAKPIISDVITSLREVSITLNHNPVKLIGEIKVNGQTAMGNQRIYPDDQVEVIDITTIKELAALYEISLEMFDLLVNNSPVNDDYIIRDSDNIFCKSKKTQKHITQNVDEYKQQTISFKKEEGSHSVPIFVNGQQTFLTSEKNEYIFVDIFNFIQFDLSKPQGTIVLKLNGNSAGFTDKIKPHDRVEIYWE